MYFFAKFSGVTTYKHFSLIDKLRIDFFFRITLNAYDYLVHIVHFIDVIKNV